MAFESKTEPASERLSALENEIPSYRAISTAAIVSLVLGLISFLNIASLWFLIASAGAVLSGVLALRRIRRFPDLLTGAGLAKAGIVAGVAFGLGATTTTVVQDLVLRSQVKAFSNHFARMLKEKTFADVSWFHSPPDYRREKSGQAILDEFRANHAREPGVFEENFGGMMKLKSDIDEKNLDVRFESIELIGMEDLLPYAGAVFEVIPKDGQGEPQLALARLRGVNSPQGRYEWIVEQVYYPYSRGTVKAPTPKIDDGHGHGDDDGHGH